MECVRIRRMVSLILASNSPRRKQLIALGGWLYEVAAAEVDETVLLGEQAADYVLRLAQSKARTAIERIAAGVALQGERGEDVLVVAADTSVVDGDQILGKPRDPDEARQMLARLRKRTHQVYTALAVMRLRDGAMLTDLCVTDVPMRDYSDEEMIAYIQTGDPLDKAGAYAIQHAGFHPVERLEGCYANVVGLPLCHLKRTLRRWGVQAAVDLPLACQETFQYTCPVFQDILANGTEDRVRTSNCEKR
ncbi:MAG: septum formation protein Maf [Anaerolineales bacterium]|nr:septum formation protein Maf [Anaerolineales bacterium]